MFVNGNRQYQLFTYANTRASIERRKTMYQRTKSPKLNGIYCFVYRVFVFIFFAMFSFDI